MAFLRDLHQLSVAPGPGGDRGDGHNPLRWERTWRRWRRWTQPTEVGEDVEETDTTH
jgi:hypothetical protein